MKNILFPTDFSDNAWSALVYTLKLYMQDECIFYFLNSTNIGTSISTNLSSSLMLTISQKAKEELIKLKEHAEISNANANHSFRVILRSDRLEDAISFAVKKYNIEMVVMGTKGATGSKKIFFGSNTVKVINKMRLCSILVVPEEYDFVTLKQIAFATGFSRDYVKKELKPLIELASSFNSKIRVIHIEINKKLNINQKYNMEKLRNHLVDYEYSFHMLPNNAKKATEINTFIEEFKIDMLTMVYYKHSLMEIIIKEPVIKEIGCHPIVPLLVIPE